MNIGSLLTRSARVFPHRPAVSQGEYRLNYAQFDRQVNRLANAFIGIGLRRGYHVVLLMYNCPQMIVAMFAIFKAGLTAVPINFRLHPKEYGYIIDQSGARAVVLTPEFNKDILGLQEQAPQVDHLISTSGAGKAMKDYESILAMGSGQFVEVDVEPDDPAWLFYTSGTTGRPKGAMLTHRNLLAMTWCYYADFGALRPGDAILHAAPLSHSSGLYALPNLAQGSHNLIPESKSFSPEQTFQVIESAGITNMFVAPTMVKLLVEARRTVRHDISSLRNMIYGGGPMHVEDLIAARKSLGNCLTLLYGIRRSSWI